MPYFSASPSGRLRPSGRWRGLKNIFRLFHRLLRCGSRGGLASLRISRLPLRGGSARQGGGEDKKSPFAKIPRDNISRGKRGFLFAEKRIIYCNIRRFLPRISRRSDGRKSILYNSRRRPLSPRLRPNRRTNQAKYRFLCRRCTRRFCP